MRFKLQLQVSGLQVHASISKSSERDRYTPWNDIQFRKCGGLFGVGAVTRRSQGIVGVEENESPSADHYPAHGETDSKKNNFTACKYEFKRARDAAWGKCPT